MKLTILLFQFNSNICDIVNTQFKWGSLVDFLIKKSFFVVFFSKNVLFIWNHYDTNCTAGRRLEQKVYLSGITMIPSHTGLYIIIVM